LPTDANNPPVQKKRLDADVVGSNPGEKLAGQEDQALQPAGTQSAAQPDPSNRETDNAGLGAPNEYPDAPEENGTMAASDDASNGDIQEVNPDGTPAPEAPESDEPVNTEAADVANDPSNVIGQGQVDAENANAEAMQKQADAEDDEDEDEDDSDEDDSDDEDSDDGDDEKKNP
jgi:hypothetical protein